MNEPPTTSERPTKARYIVLVFLASMAFILYLDRVCMSQAAPLIKEELQISETQKSVLFTAFTLSYVLFEIPTGRWGDRFGSRGVLTRIVVWWSIFTALTGAAFGFWLMLGVRFLFGAGEAGALPNSARVLKAWFPPAALGRAQGFVTASMMFGGAIAPIASQALITWVGWRWSFAVFGLLGAAWALLFYAWYRDDPAQHPAVSSAEYALIRHGRTDTQPAADVHGAIPWKAVFRCKETWLLSLAMVTMSAIYNVFSSWYPTYLQQGRGVSPWLSGWLSSLVMGAGAVGCLFGGWLTDWLVQKTGNRRWSRTAQAMVGAALAFVGLLTSVWIDNATVSAMLVALACLGVQLQLPAWWASATQISGRQIGVMFGLMNMIGNAGGAASQLFWGSFADYMKSLGYSGRAQWDPGFAVYCVVAAFGFVFWVFIDPRRAVDDPAASGMEPELAAGWAEEV